MVINISSFILIVQSHYLIKTSCTFMIISRVHPHIISHLAVYLQVQSGVIHAVAPDTPGPHFRSRYKRKYFAGNPLLPFSLDQKGSFSFFSELISIFSGNVKSGSNNCRSGTCLTSLIPLTKEVLRVAP